jgi:hypothetical protein
MKFIHSSAARFLIVIGVSITLASNAFSQQPTPAKLVKILAVTMESGAIAGSNRPWIKVVTQFQTTPAWCDGVAFSYLVLLGANNEYRVLPGTVRYANVRAGVNRAVMYISPNTVERFGGPITARVTAYYKDEPVDEGAYKSAGSPPNWERLNKYDGLLLTVIHTPWVINDYSASPDIFGQ